MMMKVHLQSDCVLLLPLYVSSLPLSAVASPITRVEPADDESFAVGALPVALQQIAVLSLLVHFESAADSGSDGDDAAHFAVDVALQFALCFLFQFQLGVHCGYGGSDGSYSYSS